MNTPSTPSSSHFVPEILPPALAGERTWQDAVCTLVDHFTTHDQCFSSGELAAELRLQRPDFRFSVPEVGEFVKDLFHGGAIEWRDRHGRVTPAIQVPRRTTGASRTPAGTEVFVYAPTPIQGLAHAFEVDIPRPAFQPTALERRRFAAVAAEADAEMIATVHGDGRLCVPRRAIERLSHATGVAIRGGDSVWLEVGALGRELRIHLAQRDGCTAHALQSERGRVRFSSPDPGQPFTPGDRFAIDVDGAALTIRLAPRTGS
ncbi:hypothetical protein ACNOYE_00475 [Nannocystaceae bacterium ST9]